MEFNCDWNWGNEQIRPETEWVFQHYHNSGLRVSSCSTDILLLPISRGLNYTTDPQSLSSVLSVCPAGLVFTSKTDLSTTPVKRSNLICLYLGNQMVLRAQSNP